MINTFEQVNGEHAGFRRNHAKGVCASGYFESHGRGTTLSKTVVFHSVRVPVIGRFALAGESWGRLMRWLSESVFLKHALITKKERIGRRRPWRLARPAITAMYHYIRAAMRDSMVSALPKFIARRQIDNVITAASATQINREKRRCFPRSGLE
jgi:catalase